MAIQINPRLTLRRTRFSALSLLHLKEYLQDIHLQLHQQNVNVDAFQKKVTDTWSDVYDSLYNGSFSRWLNQQKFTDINNNIKSLFSKRIELKFELLEKVVEALYSKHVSHEIVDYLRKEKEKEKKETTSDKPVIGKNWVLSLNNNVKMPLIWVEGGTFIMGSDDSDAYNNEKPHKVRLSGFWIGKYPMTQQQWEATGVEREGNNYYIENQLQAESFSWDEAKYFCDIITEILKNKIQFSVKNYEGEETSAEVKYQFALPTEAQWEYAARGGGKSEGYNYSGSNDLDEVGWSCDNSNGEMHNVGLKMPNELGIHDMSGNVWEWCRDCADWDDEKNEVVTDTYVEKEGGLDDPCCKVGSYRVIRGGSWNSTARRCRPSCRGFNDPTRRDSLVGFRVALVPVQ